MTRIRPRTKPRRGRVKDQAYLDWLHTQPSIVPTHDELCSEDPRKPGPGCYLTIHHDKECPGSQKHDRRGLPLWLCRHVYCFGKETIEHGKAAFEKRFGIDLEEQIRIHNERFANEKGFC